MTEIKFDTLPKDRYAEMSTWAKEQFGRPAIWVKQLDVDGGARWFPHSRTTLKEWRDDGEGSVTFSFKDEKDATLFSLRWSS